MEVHLQVPVILQPMCQTPTMAHPVKQEVNLRSAITLQRTFYVSYPYQLVIDRNMTLSACFIGILTH